MMGSMQMNVMNTNLCVEAFERAERLESVDGKIVRYLPIIDVFTHSINYFKCIDHASFGS